jgi:hypothetical protein
MKIIMLLFELYWIKGTRKLFLLLDEMAGGLRPAVIEGRRTSDEKRCNARKGHTEQMSDK